MCYQSPAFAHKIYCRDTSQLVYHERLTAMEGDVGNEDDVSLLLDRNLDSVICADSCPTMLESGIPLLVACMKKQNDVVLRLIAVTFLDGDDHHRTQGAANELIESSELPYVIISKHGPFAKDKECPNRRFLSQFCLYCGIESSCVHIGRTVDLERLDHSRYDTFIERMI